MILVRDITRSGFSLNASVHELILNEEWIWLSDWYMKYPTLAQVHVSALINCVPDRVLWMDLNGILNQFSVSLAWQFIRISENDVPWFNVCSFSVQVWSMLSMLLGMDYVPPRFEDVVEFVIPSSKAKESLLRDVLVFSFSKVFPTRFFLGRFVKDGVSIRFAYAPLVDAVGLDWRFWITTMAVFESSESESEEMVEVDIETLTMEQYLALAQGNQRSGVVRPEIGDNAEGEADRQKEKPTGRKRSRRDTFGHLLQFHLEAP
ncbi:hypothetical protein Tco_0682668 [Tanacetum coccineum]|uniref:Aminotransferase-like plant mobile domain-containing protein n=1 Tax=Tanacetum coccineum TaxID=301880 RepID=A0ABQ4XTR9_9ASTR